MTICERMFALMDEYGKKAADLCKILNLNTSQTTAWKQRNTDPPAKYIPTIARFLGVSIEFLLTGQEPAPVINSKDDEMVYMFHALPEVQQDFIFNAIKTAFDKETEAKKETARLSG